MTVTFPTDTSTWDQKIISIMITAKQEQEHGSKDHFVWKRQEPKANEGNVTLSVKGSELNNKELKMVKRDGTLIHKFEGENVDELLSIPPEELVGARAILSQETLASMFMSDKEEVLSDLMLTSLNAGEHLHLDVMAALQ